MNKIGTTISFNIKRNNKVIYEQVDLKNFIYNEYFCIDDARHNFTSFSTGNVYLGLSNSPLYSEDSPSIQYKQENNVITANPISNFFNSKTGQFQWPGGIYGGSKNFGGGVTGIFDITHKENVNLQSGLRLYQPIGSISSFFATSSGNGNSGQLAFAAPTYDNAGKLKIEFKPEAVLYCISPIDTTLTYISVFPWSTDNRFLAYNIPNGPVQIQKDDIITVTNIKMVMDHGDVAPIEFATSPISNITSSGKYQSLIPINSSIQQPLTLTRVYFASDANKITLTDRLGLNVPTLKVNAYNFDKTITSVNATKVTPSSSNDFTLSEQVVIILSEAFNNCKQILFGTTTELYYVIEFDTPQNFAIGKTLKLKRSQQMLGQSPIF